MLCEHSFIHSIAVLRACDMSNLTDDQRLQIATLVDHTDKTVRQIADDLRISKSAAGRVVQRYKATGCYKSLKNECGRKRISTPADDRVLIRLSKADPTLSACQLQGEMASRGISMSERTVQYRLLEGGRKPYKPIKCQVLTPQMKKKRMQWAIEHKDWTLDMWRSVSSFSGIVQEILFDTYASVFIFISDNILR